MDFSIVWTEPALANLEAIVRYIAERSPAAAESVRDDILNSVEVLSRFPFIGPAYERDRTGQVREIVCRQYRIFYQVNDAESKVEILSVWHGSRREPDFSS